MQSAAEPEVAAAESALAMIPAPSALKHRSSSGDGNGGDRSSSGASGNGPERKLSKVLTFSPHALVIQPEWERRLQRLANAIVRGAGAGFCLRGGLNLVRTSDFTRNHPPVRLGQPRSVCAKSVSYLCNALCVQSARTSH